MKGVLTLQEIGSQGQRRQAVEFDSYFDSCELAYGTLIYQSFAFPSLSLDQIHKLCPGFVPPQATINWRDNWDMQPEWIEAMNRGRDKLMQEGRLSKQLNLLAYQ